MAGDDAPEKNEEEKDSELDLLAEQELVRLTRQFRVMEGDKEAYLEEANKALKRQRQNIQELENEKTQMARSLKTSRSKQNKLKDEKNTDSVYQLIEGQDNLNVMIKREIAAGKDLSTEINRIERQIAQQRKTANQMGQPSAQQNTGGQMSSMKEKKDIGKRIVLLENRLDGVMINFNATLAHNSSVRKEIDHLVQERATFNDMIARLQKKVAGNKKIVNDITEMAILAFDQRDEAQSKITALQDRNEKDAQQYAAELKELQRTLDHDEKLKDFLFHKSNDRAFAADFAEEERERDRKEAEAKDIEHNKMFKDAFERIKQVVATDASLDKIVADFIKVEDQNFALFNYVTEMNSQVESSQETIAKFRIDIKEAKGRGDERERQQRDQLNSMERRVALSIREADMTEAKLDLMEGVIAKLKIGVEELYMACQVGSTPVLSLLGGLSKTEDIQRPFVTEHNIIMYLDMVNERVIELKSIAQFVDAQAKIKEGIRKDTLPDAKALAGFSGLFVDKKRQPKKMPSCAALLGKAEEEEGSDLSEAANILPFEMGTLKSRAFKLSKKEREEELKEVEAQMIEGAKSLQRRRTSKPNTGKMK